MGRKLESKPKNIHSEKEELPKRRSTRVRKVPKNELPEFDPSSVPDLLDAGCAGCRGGDKVSPCTLILVEGVSAAGHVLRCGDNILDYDMFGIFPINGKIINPRNKTPKKVWKNKLVNTIASIIGLEKEKGDVDLTSLRYGRVLIMSDQDVDRFHIRGLVLNLFHYLWPSLLKIRFLEILTCPLIKATTNINGGGVRLFYNSWESSNFSKQNVDWTFKYFKGLSSIPDEDLMGYLQDFNTNQKYFIWEDSDDDAAFELAFGKGKGSASNRNLWIQEVELSILKGTVNFEFLDQSKKLYRYCHFLTRELIIFFVENRLRTIPSVVDGLIPVRRKILCSMFQEEGSKEEGSKDDSKKVEKIGVDVSDHGREGTEKAMLNFARNYIGSGNIQVLSLDSSSGQDRNTSKNKSTGTRYLSAKLNAIARLLFPEVDDAFLPKVMDNDKCLQPSLYAPIIPLVLANGVRGIGSGCSTRIPSFDPKVICYNIRQKLDDKRMVEMDPWFVGYEGYVEKCGPYFISKGLISFDEPKSEVWISEIPIYTLVNSYLQFLLRLKAQGRITKVTQKAMAGNADFKIEMSKKQFKAAKLEGFEKVFKIISKISMDNMVLFDQEGIIKKYGNPHQIIEDFYESRLKLYERRKDLQSNLAKLKESISFVEEPGVILFQPPEEVTNKMTIDKIRCFEMKKGTDGRFFCDLTSAFHEHFPSYLEKWLLECGSEIEDLNSSIEQLESRGSKFLWKSDLKALEEKLEELGSIEAGRNSKRPKTIS